ncbi:2-dehydropantoate 2-reductase [Calditerrivibrio nitroreducens]|uniref:2-dehydropantoate 2-reductase n=1 Tax=Calditerrivibrio nitroreducens TaxID=477976 RepID=UPI003C74DBD9
MKMLCFGAGAVGSLFCGLMANKGYNIDFIARGEHLKRLQDKGSLTINSYRYGHIIVPVKAYDIPQSQYDIVFIAVKSQDTANACASIKDFIKPESIIISMQNGIDNPSTIASLLPDHKVVAASVFVGSSVDSPGEVTHSADGRIILGAYTSNVLESDLKLIKMIFDRIDVPCAISDDIKLVMWKKLLWNLIFNPLSALLEATCGKLVENDHSRYIMEKMLVEGCLAAKKDGVEIPQDYLEKIMDVKGNLYNYKTSMLQDIQKLKIPEVDGIMLPVINRLKDTNPAPYTETIYKLLKYKYGKKYIYTPKLTVDMIVCNSKNEILLIERKNPPYGWAIPGGFVDYGETVENAAKRELEEETGIAVNKFEMLGVYSDPGRDIRFHTVSIVYYTFSDDDPKAADDAKDAKFFNIDKLPEDIAFDHKKIIEDFKNILKNRGWNGFKS